MCIYWRGRGGGGGGGGCSATTSPKNKSWLALVTYVMCLDECELSTVFTHQNGNSVVTGEGQASENAVDAFKRKMSTFRKDR